MPGFLPSGEIEMRAARFSCGTLMLGAGGAGVLESAMRRCKFVTRGNGSDLGRRGCICTLLALCRDGRRSCAHRHLWVWIYDRGGGDVQIGRICFGVRDFRYGDVAHYTPPRGRSCGGGRKPKLWLGNLRSRPLDHIRQLRIDLGRCFWCIGLNQGLARMRNLDGNRKNCLARMIGIRA